ncbi:MAG: HAMP domain-containing sensor histidine kinase [Candidatus Faecousia sp.]|uniref:sensor histidine kinase n=1 Tax=Faecousia sp. TaxID=2952921 RepID=UPI002A8E0C60|nr:HAMP domain-containing sensor histidine kinase [Candidatus Faecousia sp.]
MKTTYRRQFTMILCLLVAAILVIGLSFLYLFDRYAQDHQKQSLDDTAQSVTELVQSYSATYLNSWEFRTNLAVAARASDNDIVICNSEGVVCICMERSNCEHLGKRLDSDTVDTLFQGEKAKLNKAVSTLYGDERMASAIAVLNSDGSRLCIVVVSVQKAAITALTEKMLRVFLLAALLILVAALLAIPIFTRREARPIQEMAAAARQIAHGNLDVRVPTGNENEELEELAVAFNNMTLALKNSETIRNEFVANISHELKTPMTTIAGYLDGMLDGTIPPEKYRYYMELVSTEARRLSRLVRSMLDISRLRDQGIPADQKTNFDICEAAGQALLCFEQRINQKKLNVEIDMPDEGLTIHAAQDSVTQVLYNLIDNAVKFVNEGGTLSVRIRRHGNSAMISVGNTGKTIPPEELPLVFDRFHKIDKSRSNDRDGWGLGLYIVKTIVLAHGEDVYVTSQDGKTEFTFSMSLAK